MDRSSANPLTQQPNHHDPATGGQFEDDGGPIKATTDFLEQWTCRITCDSMAIWESKDMLTYLSLMTVRKIRLSWVDSTVTCFLSQVQQRMQETETTNEQIEQMYQKYIAYFHEMASIIISTKRQKDLDAAVPEFHNLFDRTVKGDESQEAKSEEEALLMIFPVASAHPTEGSSLVYELLRGRPHALLQLQC
jgi:hypothetical protein